MLPQSNVHNASGQLRILKGCNIPRKKILEDKQTLKYVFNPCHSMDSPNDIATISMMKLCFKGSKVIFFKTIIYLWKNAFGECC